LALKLADYIVTERGFGADMGFEKFIDIVCRKARIAPDVVVVVATTQALRQHGGDPDGGIHALEAGVENLRANVRIVKRFGLPCVIAVNRFPGDIAEEIDAAVRAARELDVEGVAVNRGFELGGEGATDLARAVVAAVPATPPAPVYLYGLDDPIE